MMTVVRPEPAHKTAGHGWLTSRPAANPRPFMLYIRVAQTQGLRRPRSATIGETGVRSSGLQLFAQKCQGTVL
jgi:hypothetical protein